ncbi:invasion associated locus B family protein [Bradyrhizobium iriomotense]|uniref:invasion associated locus B family protein n=1 Tax=Bradyrhizobium iriomotense TaxID=441950 RepID=UPI001B8A388C|nr:invasion associated locus B family protein [Bradyrhizobium iriomotense]MBR0785292.1 invasion associated locus B family protein [Bradyrhizobium iriomotense]
MRSDLKLLGSAGVIAASIAIGVGLYVALGGAVSAGGDAPQSAQRPDPGLLGVALAQASQAAATLPGGASSLNEMYRDWQVACEQQGTGKRCVMSQQQINPQTRQRVLAVEINSVAPNKVEGVLMLPFGLALDSGATLQIDDGVAAPPLRYRTCLPGGCLVPLSFDAGTLSALRRGTALKIATIADGGKATPFSISLQGFAAALDRVAALAR